MTKHEILRSEETTPILAITITPNTPINSALTSPEFPPAPPAPDPTLPPSDSTSSQQDQSVEDWRKFLTLTSSDERAILEQQFDESKKKAEEKRLATEKTVKESLENQQEALRKLQLKAKKQIEENERKELLNSQILQGIDPNTVGDGETVEFVYITRLVSSKTLSLNPKPDNPRSRTSSAPPEIDTSITEEASDSKSPSTRARCARIAPYASSRNTTLAPPSTTPSSPTSIGLAAASRTRSSPVDRIALK